jgi:hypothetical protein
MYLEKYITKEGNSREYSLMASIAEWMSYSVAAVPVPGAELYGVECLKANVP